MPEGGNYGSDVAHASSYLCFPATGSGVDIVTVKELLGHSTVLVTMRYLHPNLEAKVQAVAKLAANCDKSVTVRPKMQQLIPKVSQINR